MQITFEGIQLQVEYEYEPAERGDREPGTGLLLSPDIEEQFDLTSVKVVDPDADILEMLNAGGLCRLTEAVKEAVES